MQFTGAQRSRRAPISCSPKALEFTRQAAGSTDPSASAIIHAKALRTVAPHQQVVRALGCRNQSAVNAKPCASTLKKAVRQ